MTQIIRVGVDIAKNVFEVHAVMSKVVGPDERTALAAYRGGIMFELGCHVIDLVVGVVIFVVVVAVAAVLMALLQAVLPSGASGGVAPGTGRAARGGEPSPGERASASDAVLPDEATGEPDGSPRGRDRPSGD